MSNPTEQRSSWSNFLRTKGLPLALLLSLIINIGLLGFLAGRWSNTGATPHMPPPTIGMGRFLRNLDEARRNELKPYLSAHFDSLRPNIRTSRKAYRAVRAAIAAQPFTPATLEQALVTLNNNRGAGAAEQASTLTALVEQLSSQERVQLATSMQRRRGHNARSMRQSMDQGHRLNKEPQE